MSGGSYNYLFLNDAAELFNGSMSDLEEMVERLEGLGYADDVASEARFLLNQARIVEELLDKGMTALAPVFRAVEWWDSNDTTEEQVKIAIEKHREGRNDSSQTST